MPGRDAKKRNPRFAWTSCGSFPRLGVPVYPLNKPERAPMNVSQTPVKYPTKTFVGCPDGGDGSDLEPSAIFRRCPAHERCSPALARLQGLEV